MIPRAWHLLSVSISLVTAQQLPQPSPCIRWAHQSTLVDQTLWIYGGQVRISTDQDSQNTWTNALISLDLTQPFSVSSPPVTLVEPDSDDYNSPPKVALGSLWQSNSKLYQINGEFSDKPPVTPSEPQLWEYDIAAGTWSTMQTTGDNLKRVAEGAGALVPRQGTNNASVGYYFGGHQDSYTSSSWIGQRQFLNTLQQLDLGSFALKTLTQDDYASWGSSGTSNSTVDPVPLNRADGTLTYVPKLGTDSKGILVSIGGGDQFQMIQNNILSVYDLGAQAWMSQPTTGQTPGPRMNHCAVRGSARVNGELQSHIIIYGGQAANRTTQITEGSMADIYILTIPAFEWTFVGNNLPSQPVPRVGHTCTLVGDAMISVGGYISEDYICDRPGISVFNTTTTQWVTDYIPNTNFQTPQIVKGVVGGSGTGDGSDETSDTSTNSTLPTQGQSGNGNLQNKLSSSHLGAILGAVCGTLVAGFIVFGLLRLFAMRQRKRERSRMHTHTRIRSLDSSHSDEMVERVNTFSVPYHSSLEGSSPRGSTQSYNGVLTYHKAANDEDLEEVTSNMEAHFSSASLAPRQQLRITNPSPYNDPSAATTRISLNPFEDVEQGR